MPASYYETLNVSTKVTRVDLVLAYFARASLAHPKVASTSDAQRNFLIYSEAFAVLYDAKSRFRYDAHLKTGSAQPFHVPIDESTGLALYEQMAEFIAGSYAADGMQGEEIYNYLLQMSCPENIANRAVSAGIAPIQALAAKNEFWKRVRTILLWPMLFLPTLFIPIPSGLNSAVFLMIMAALVSCICVIYYRNGAPYLEVSTHRTLGMEQLEDFHNKSDRYFKKR